MCTCAQQQRSNNGAYFEYAACAQWNCILTQGLNLLLAKTQPTTHTVPTPAPTVAATPEATPVSTAAATDENGHVITPGQSTTNGASPTLVTRLLTVGTAVGALLLAAAPAVL
jgi:hypothetical protein